MWLLVVAFSLLIVVAKGNHCPVHGKRVPSQIALDPASKFDFLESGLTICPSYTMPCSGYLKQWQFIAVNPYVIGLHLAVFRRRPHTAAIYDLVGSTYLNALRTPQKMREAWIYQPVDPPIAVKRNDVLGFFYDDFKTRNELLTIGTRRFFETADRKNFTNFKPCLVTIADNKSFATHKMIDMSVAVEDDRLPGVVAIVIGHPNGNIKDLDDGTDDYYDEWDKDHGAEEPPIRTSSATSTASFTVKVKAKPVSQLKLHGLTHVDDDNFVLKPIGDQLAALPKPVQQSKLDANSFKKPATIVSKFDLEKTKDEKSIPSLCMKTPTALQLCPEAGLRAFYDYRYSLCQPFYGCPPLNEGSENNFGSMEMCRLTCS